MQEGVCLTLSVVFCSYMGFHFHWHEFDLFCASPFFFNNQLNSIFLGHPLPFFPCRHPSSTVLTEQSCCSTCPIYLPTARCTSVQSTVLRLHVVCLSVLLSMMLVYQDHIGWKSWKLIAWTINPTPSSFVAQRPSTYSQGNMVKFWGD